MAPRGTKNKAYAKFGVTNKEHYGSYGVFWGGHSVLNLLMDVFLTKDQSRQVCLRGQSWCRGFSWS